MQIDSEYTLKLHKKAKTIFSMTLHVKSQAILSLDAKKWSKDIYNKTNATSY